VKAEEYEAAVNALLEALGLDPASTLEVRVQPHQATAKVISGEVSTFAEGTKPLTDDVVIARDDAPAVHQFGQAFDKMSADLASFDNANPAEVMALYALATQGKPVSAVAIGKYITEALNNYKRYRR
jgi:hypothetical protein